MTTPPGPDPDPDATLALTPTPTLADLGWRRLDAFRAGRPSLMPFASAMTPAGVKAGIKDLAKAYGSLKAPPQPTQPLPSPLSTSLDPHASRLAPCSSPLTTPLTPHLPPHLTSPLKASLVACKEHVAELDVAKLALALETGFEHPATFLFEYAVFGSGKLVSHTPTRALTLTPTRTLTLAPTRTLTLT